MSRHLLPDYERFSDAELYRAIRQTAERITHAPLSLPDRYVDDLEDRLAELTAEAEFRQERAS